jgi:hypothetical protein
MKSRALTFLALLALASGLIAAGIAVKSAHAAGVTKYTGSIGGAAYLIEVPAQWNGTLVLYSHGYVQPGASNPAHDVGAGPSSRRSTTRSPCWMIFTRSLASTALRGPSPGGTHSAASSRQGWYSSTLTVSRARCQCAAC